MTRDENTPAAIEAWFGGRLPSEWTDRPARVSVDREEILVVLTIPAPQTSEQPGTPERAETSERAETPASQPEASPQPGTAGEPDAAQAAAIAGRISRFREETRERRIGIAREAEHRFRKKVAWAVASGGTEQVFTSLAVPVMTRLRQPERLVLDTLVDSGVARSRAHALAWCVRLVGDNAASWLGDLRTAMAEVEKVRDAGPPQSV